MSVALLAAACASRGPIFASVAPPPVPVEEARIHFYRAYQPYQSLARPWISLNGQETAISELGGVSTRDVQPGAYEELMGRLEAREGHVCRDARGRRSGARRDGEPALRRRSWLLIARATWEGDEQ
jgi:hypothetical protein